MRQFSCFLAILLFAGAVPRVSSAQTQLASSIVSTDTGCIVVVCGPVTDKPAAVDSQIATAAVISPPQALSSAALRVGFASAVPTGAHVAVTLSFSGGALNLGLVNQTSITTFNSLAGPTQQSIPLNTMLNLTVLSSNVMTV